MKLLPYCRFIELVDYAKDNMGDILDEELFFSSE